MNKWTIQLSNLTLVLLPAPHLLVHHPLHPALPPAHHPLHLAHPLVPLLLVHLVHLLLPVPVLVMNIMNFK